MFLDRGRGSAQAPAGGGRRQRTGGSGADDGAWDLPSSIAAPVTGTRGLAGKLTIRALRWMGF